MEQRLVAFSAYQVCRVTELSLGQLQYWDRTGFFAPEFPSEGERYGAFTRIYSFRDLVGLYTVSLLRKRYRFSLQKLRPVGEYLHRYNDTPWASLVLYVAGSDIVFKHPVEPGTFIGTLPKPGQTMIPISMERIARDVENRTNKFRRRGTDQIGKIERNRYIVHNAPVLAGTRIPTLAVLHLREAGYSDEHITREYPRLRSEDIQAAIAFETRRKQRA